MNKRILAGAVIMATSVMLSVSGIAFADKDKENDNGEYSKDGYSIFERTATIPAVTSKLYAAECGACHFAYQPGWLPAHSWQKIMGALDQHFGENAELGQESGDAITRYLVAASADNKPNRMSSRVLRSFRANETPLRISGLRYILKKHDEIPERFIKGNARVGSRANCAACHTEAAAGYFNEDGVNIPGHGSWED